MSNYDKAFTMRPISFKSDSEFLAYLVPFQGADDIISFVKPGDRELPPNIYFQTNFKLLNKTDFPSNDTGWPIISKKMYKALLSSGNFPHKTFPVIMVDDTIPWEERTDKNGNIREDIINTDFLAIQITDFIEAFDYNKSIYEEHELVPGKVGFIEKLVLIDLETELPPLFLVKELSTTLFISRGAKEHLDRNGIKGIEYDDLSHPFWEFTSMIHNEQAYTIWTDYEKNDSGFISYIVPFKGSTCPGQAFL